MDDDRLTRLEQRLADLEERERALEERETALEKRESALEKTIDAAMEKSRAAMTSMLPTETRAHIRAAGREQLLVVRSLLDHWVGRLDQPASRASSDERAEARQDIPID